MNEYKSVEQILWEKATPIKDFIKEAIRGAYSVSIAPLRLPTTIRKLANHQSISDQKDMGSNAKNIGFAAGVILGAFVTYGGSIVSAFYQENSGGGDSIATYGAGLILATNAISLIYEAGRFSKSRQEYKSLRQAETSSTGNLEDSLVPCTSNKSKRD